MKPRPQWALRPIFFQAESVAAMAAPTVSAKLKSDKSRGSLFKSMKRLAVSRKSLTQEPPQVPQSIRQAFALFDTDGDVSAILCAPRVCSRPARAKILLV